MPNELQKLLIELSEKPINMNINIPGLKGVDGTDGRNGADGLSAYDIAQLEGFKGSRQEWLDSLKAKVEVNNAFTALKRKNIYLPNAQLDTILTKLVELMGDTITVTPKPLTYTQPAAGQAFIKFTGEPHFKVAINDGEKVEFETSTLKVLIPQGATGNIKADYFNLLDEIVSTSVITLNNVNEGPDFGTFTKDTQLTSNMGGVTVAGIGKVYEKGVKVIPTTLESTNKFNLEDMFKDMTERICEYKKVEFVELDLTQLPDNPPKGGNFPEVCKNLIDLVNSGNNTIVKVRRGQVITVSEDPMSPNKTGEATSIKFTGVANKKIQFNGSELVDMQQGARYEYVFSTDTINKLG
jgi:conserved domain protein